MQTTLMGLAIALILALLAALIGPHFVNWNDHRATFEAEASRLVGLQVRVGGNIDVRILPFPSMQLADIEIGPAGQSSRLRARSLGVEFGLGPLMRGELRAVEVRLVQPQVGLGLNSLGQIDWPAMTLVTDTLAIDRLRIEDARIVLTDAASQTRIDLNKLSFSGELRSLAGPVRGDGTFVAAGTNYTYRLSTSRLSDEGLRLKLALDDAERPLNAEIDGLVAFERTPRFEGNLQLWRPAGVVQAGGRVSAQEPWRLSGRVAATPQGALIQEIAFQYGPEERAATLSGTADFKFGEKPSLRAALSARQIDLDRLVATPQAPRRAPLATIQNFAEQFSETMRPSLPATLAISIDAVTLGGALAQNVGADLHSDGNGWRIGKLEFRAPGFSKVSLSGRLDRSAAGLSFAGTTNIDANDPRSLVAWLAGRGSVPAQIRPLRLSGELTLGPDRIGVEQLKASFDRGTLDGRLAYFWATNSRPARLDAEITAGELDLDAVMQFGTAALGGLELERPKEVALSLDIERARLAGFEARKALARLQFDADGIAIERLSIANFGNATIQASGRIATTAQPGGNLTIDLDAPDLGGVIALTEKFAPTLTAPLRHLAGRQPSAKLNVTLGLDRSRDGDTTGKLTATGRIGAFRVDLRGTAPGKPADFVLTDPQLFGLAGTRLDATLEADDGAALLALIGLDRFAVTQTGSARLTIASAGPLGGDMRLEGKLVGGLFDLAAKGQIRQPAEAPLTLALDQLSGSIGGSPLRGGLVVKFAESPQVEGTLETDRIDLPAAFAIALGMAPRQTKSAAAWPLEPFRQSTSGLTGRVAFTAQRASLSPTLAARRLRGTLNFGPSEIRIEDVNADLAGGRLAGGLTIGTDRSGVSASAKIALNGADAAVVSPGRALRSGKISFDADLTGSGLSPAAFVGSISGTGSVTLDNARIAGVNPRVFDAVIRAVELGIPTDINRIRDFVASSLDTGDLTVRHVKTAVAFKDGRARIANVAIGQGTDIQVTASADLADATLDAVLTLTGAPIENSPIRPTLFVMLKGPLAKPARNIEADALASWLTLRAVEQQSRKLETMERTSAVPASQPSASQSLAPQTSAPQTSVPQILAPQSLAPQSLAPQTLAPAAASPADANGSADVAKQDVANPQVATPNANAPGLSPPPLPPAINVLPAPRPRAEQLAPPPAARQEPRPPATKPGWPLDLLDLLGAQR